MSFGNSILAGEELVRTAIRSANYVPGVSGWRIDRLGNAEFNGGTFRGAVVVTGPNGSVTITNDPIFGAVVLFTDSSGYQWRERATVSGTIHSFAIENINGTASLGLSYDSSTLQTLMGIIANEFAVVASARSDFPGETHLGVNGNLFDATGWTSVSFQNGWVDVGGAENLTQYRRRGRSVEVIGTVKSGTIGQTVFTLPAGFRPKGQTEKSTPASGGTVAQVAINAVNGNVVIVNGSATATSMDFMFPTD